MIPDVNLCVCVQKQTVSSKLKASTNKLNNLNKLHSIITDLSTEGILKGVDYSNSKVRFKYKNNSIKDLLNLIKKENSIKIIKKKLKD